jgi:glycosyltransferase involved in cell wall biosynthesis
VPGLVDPARVRADEDAEATRAAMRRRLGLSGDEWVAAYAGSLASWQEIPRVIALARHLIERVPQFRLLFLTPERERAIAMLRAGGLAEGRFRVLSPAARDVIDTLLAADAGVLLRRPCVANAVAFPTKAAEYLAAGLAIVTTDAVESIVGLLTRRPIAGIVVPFSAEDDVLAARLAGATRPDTPEERAGRRAVAREELSGAAAAPVLRRVYGEMRR